MAVYAFYAEKARAYPRLYKNSTDRAAMDAARKLLPATPDDLTAASLTARQRRLDEWGDRIKRGQWASRQEVEFSTVVAQSPVKAPAKTTVTAKPVATASATPASVKVPTRSTGGTPSATPPAASASTVTQRAVSAPKSFPPRTVTIPVAQKSRVLPPSVSTPQPQVPATQAPTKPPAKRTPSLPERVSSGGSLERPTEAASAPTPVSPNTTAARVIEHQRAVPQPPVVGGDDFLHRLQRMFKRGS